ncbi:UNVERIFIED_CONTAM: hypothetical protein Sangu_2473200 [Sesamum angustifolium]|uniref:Uncharacterized protein n=1 Tax=Sesamum angustifolium TaxID=2727405 RepID=A0AAW2IQT8_9LAMI
MVANAYDVQVFLWKMIKLSSETCVTFSINYPYVSFSLLCIFLLYMSFPLAFWVLIYSIPLVVCTCIILCISFNYGNGKKCKDKDDEQKDRKTKTAAEDSTLDRSKTSFKRVHSVRRRRAKDISIEDNTQNNNVEEKAAISSTNVNNHDMVDTNALTEESPKEIREVEVDKSPASNTKGSCQSLTHENSDQGYDQKENLKGLDDEEEVTNNKNYTATQGNEDDQKIAIDVGISNMERSKRLESLIARRRSRKLLSLQVRKTLLNKDKDDKSGQISSLIIPKHYNPFLPYNLASPFSPGPGSAPSVLIPMRNPFDLPYDPQEEKPDLTGDSFQQEFMSVNKDVMFCRHESFSLGSCLSGHNHLEEISMVHDFGFIQRASPKVHRFSRSKSEVDRAYAPMVEQGSFEVFQSKPSTEYPVDHIKEVIEVSDNSTQDHAEQNNDEVQIKPAVQEEGLSMSSPSSSEEDVPIFKIDKEAILKSLSSMARRNIILERENHEQIGEQLNCATSHFENTLRLRTPSYSIASDLQVEVSEVSSPPLTIDENFSYQDEVASTHVRDMETNITSDIGDMWAGSSHQFGSDENEVNMVNKQDSDGCGLSRTNNLEDMITLSNSTEESLNEKYGIQSSLHSPSNVELHKSCRAEATNPHEKVHEPLQTSVDSIICRQGDSLENLAFAIHEKKQQSEMNLESQTLHENDSSKLNESSEPSQVASVEVDDAESINKEKIPGSSIKSQDAANNSSQQLSGHETSMEMVNQINKISSTPFSNNDKVSIENFQAVGPTASSKDKDFDNNSSSSQSIEKELSEHQEKVIGEGLVEATESSESYANYDHNSKDKQHENSHVPMLVAESTLEAITTSDGEPEPPITCTKKCPRSCTTVEVLFEWI